MATYTWQTNTTNSGAILDAVKSVVPGLLWNGTDGSYVNGANGVGGLLVTLVVPDGNNPGAGVINNTSLNNALAPIITVVENNASADLSDRQANVLNNLEDDFNTFIALTGNATAAQLTALGKDLAKVGKFLIRRIRAGEL